MPRPSRLFFSVPVMEMRSRSSGLEISTIAWAAVPIQPRSRLGRGVDLSKHDNISFFIFFLPSKEHAAGRRAWRYPENNLVRSICASPACVTCHVFVATRCTSLGEDSNAPGWRYHTHLVLRASEYLLSPPYVSQIIFVQHLTTSDSCVRLAAAACASPFVLRASCFVLWL